MPNTQGLTSSFSIHWSELLEEVYQERHTHEYSKSAKILLYPNDVWIVCRGIVQLSTIQLEGNESILGLVYPGMPFGLPFTQISPYEAIALSDVVLMRLSQVELEHSPRLAQGIQVQLNRRLQQTEALLALNHHHHVSARLQELLLLLAREVGEQTSNGNRIGVRLTHNQIAELTGSTRVSITRLLGVLQRNGWLSIDKTRHFIVHSSVFLDSSPLVY